MKTSLSVRLNPSLLKRPFPSRFVVAEAFLDEVFRALIAFNHQSRGLHEADTLWVSPELYDYISATMVKFVTIKRYLLELSPCLKTIEKIPQLEGIAVLFDSTAQAEQHSADPVGWLTAKPVLYPMSILVLTQPNASFR